MIHTLLNLTRPLIIFDTETTGVDVQKDRIVELGYEMWTNEGLIKEWRTLINPGVPMPAGAEAVHHISDAMLQGCQTCGQDLGWHGDLGGPDACSFKPWPTFKDVASQLAAWFRLCDFAGKNVRFDLRITANEMARHGQDWSYAGARVIDAERIEQIAVPRSLSDLYAKYVRVPCDECGGKGEYLDAPGNVLDGTSYMTKCQVCKGEGTLGKKHDGAHGALSDVRASTTVIVHQLQTYDGLPRDIDALHEAQWPGWLTSDGAFRLVEGVATCMFGKHRGVAVKDIPISYFDWILSANFPIDVCELARDAKMGKYSA